MNNNLSFKSYIVFGKDQQMERRTLIEALVNRVWSPERLKEVAA